jgi:hypothetical protein
MHDEVSPSSTPVHTPLYCRAPSLDRMQQRGALQRLANRKSLKLIPLRLIIAYSDERSASSRHPITLLITGYVRSNLPNMLGIDSPRYIAPTIEEMMKRYESTHTHEIDDVFPLLCDLVYKVHNAQEAFKSYSMVGPSVAQEIKADIPRRP